MFDKNSATQGSVVGYMDSIYGDDLDIRFLVGYVFTLTSHAISWKAISVVYSSRLY